VDRRVKISSAPAPRPSFAAQFQGFVRRNLTWFLVAGLALLLLQDIFGTHGVLAMRRSQQQAAEMQKQIDDLNEENKKLENGVKSLKSDPAAIERIARQDMGLSRPGEFVFKIQPDTDSKQPAQPAINPSK
jgi:cell division protein FtsB